MTLAAAFLAGILLLAMPVSGAGQTNLTIQTTGEVVSPGETITVTISNGPMTVSTVTGGFSFDTSLFYVSSIRIGSNAPEIVSTTEEANTYGTVGFASLGTSDTYHKAGTCVIADLIAKTPGVANLTLYEDSDGADGFSSKAAGVITEQITDENGAVPAGAAGGTGAAGTPGDNAGTGTNTGAAAAAGTNGTGSNAEGTNASGGNRIKNGNGDQSGAGAAASGSASDDQKKITPGSRPVWPYAVGAGVVLAAIIVVFLIILKMKNRPERMSDMEGKDRTDRTDHADGAEEPVPDRTEADSDGNEDSADKPEEGERGERS